MPKWIVFAGTVFVVLVVFASLRQAGSSDDLDTKSRNLINVIPGESGGDMLGMMIVAAGDVDGDGTEDFAAGVPYHDGHPGPNSGQVIVYSGADTSIIHEIDGQQAGEQFGKELCLGDDIDSDGVPDLLVGAPNHDNNQVPDCGRVYIVSGSTGAFLCTLVGEEASEKFGLSIARAGDFNGDGITEILIGAPTYEGPLGINTGRAFLCTMTGYKIGTATGEAAGDLFGYTMCAVENSGGGPPLYWLFGAPLHDDGQFVDSGRVYVYSLALMSFTATFDGDKNRQLFGSALNSSGDFNGDGRNDVIVGAWGHDGSAGDNSGKIVVLSGSNGAKLHDIEGDGVRSQFGSVVDSLKDLNNDGCDEILVSAPWFNNTVGSQAGRVYLFDGKTGALHKAIYPGSGFTYAGDYFGTGMAAISDVTGDGKGDILGGAPSHGIPTSRTDFGRIYVFSGPGGEKVHTIDGYKGGDQFGYCLDGGVSDVDGDGTPDLIIGAVGHNQPGEEPTLGRVYAISAHDGSTIMTVDGDQSEALFGIALASMGDVSDDGLGDFLVGAPHYEVLSNPMAGRAYLYFGGQPTPATVLSGANAEDLFGTAVARVADYDGDGKADFLVGAPGFGNATGQVSLFSGANGSLIRLFDGEFPGDRFGEALSSAGDVDYDGKDDLLLGAPGYDAPGLLDCGRVYLFSGADFSLLGSVDGQNDDDAFGGAVDRIGDITGDGHGEFIVGAEIHSGTPGYHCGAAYVFSGATMQALYTFEGGNNRSHLGHDVAGIGDANGDLVNDFCISGHRHSDIGIGTGDFGRVYVYSGSDGSLLDYYDGEEADWLGTSISGVGDVNSDGRCDIMASAPLSNDVEPGYNAGNVGKVYVFSVGP